jgi:hypothetical protein
MAAAEFEREQARLRAEAERLPQMTRDTADQMRRALHDQMRALEQVSALAVRTAAQRDVTPPAGSPTYSPPPQRALPQPATLTETLAAEMLRRQAEAPQQPPPPAQAPATNGWRLSEVLARAARDEATLAPVPAAPNAAAAPSAPLNLDQIAAALDVPTAAAIWSKLRSGQRGVLVRSIYVADGRAIFDQVQRRFATEMEFRGMVERFLSDFERVLRDAEARDPSGQVLQNHLISSSGRIYLFLAHASGRLA